MQDSHNPADPFKKALAEATKVLANDPELSVTFSVDPPADPPIAYAYPK